MRCGTAYCYDPGPRSPAIELVLTTGMAVLVGASWVLDLRLLGLNRSPDGKRFLMIRRDLGSVPRQLNVILNWSDRGE